MRFRGLLLAITIAVSACRKEPPPPSSMPTRDTAPLGSNAATSEACASYRQGSGARNLAYTIPGDPASHPGCTLLEAGDLQCPDDFAQWTPKSKVTVPSSDARGLLDDAERDAFATGCKPCPRSNGNGYAAGYDPSQYPLRLCKGDQCLEVCAPLKQRLLDLRKRFASTRAATTADISHPPPSGN